LFDFALVAMVLHRTENFALEFARYPWGLWRNVW